MSRHSSTSVTPTCSASATHLSPFGGRFCVDAESAPDALSELEWRASWRGQVPEGLDALPEAVKRLQHAISGPFVERAES